MMDYTQRQREVEAVRAALHRDSVASPSLLKEPLAGRPEDLRRDIYALYWRLGTSPEEKPVLRNAILQFMLQQVQGETPMLKGQLLKWLRDFHPNDFNQDTRNAVLELAWDSEYTPEIIRLIGVAEARAAIPRVEAQIVKEPLPDQPRAGYQAGNTWAALLALARMGDEKALARVIRQVGREPDIILRATVLFQDLAYTRRPGAFEALRGYLNSEARLPQIKSNVPGRLEAAYAAAAFSRYVEGFPIQETDLSEQQVLQVRAWVNAQKILRIK
jgi:hypothetical protein